MNRDPSIWRLAIIQYIRPLQLTGAKIIMMAIERRAVGPSFDRHHDIPQAELFWTLSIAIMMICVNHAACRLHGLHNSPSITCNYCSQGCISIRWLFIYYASNCWQTASDVQNSTCYIVVEQQHKRYRHSQYTQTTGSLFTLKLRLINTI